MNMSEPFTTEQLLGRWRITEMSAWDADALDLVQPASVEFEPDGMGSIRFIAIRGGIDYRLSRDDDRLRVEFTWEGVSEGDAICGRVSATLDHGVLTGVLFIHLGDESSFVARRFDREQEGGS